MIGQLEQRPARPSMALRASLAAAAAGDGPFSPARLAKLDLDEAFPVEQCALLDELGLPAYYVPVALGGRLDDHEELLALWRSVARHDLSAIVAHGKTYLGAVCAWVAGTPDQARALAEHVLAGSPVAWALSEPEHGADLLAGEVAARARGGSYELSGTKWPVNNATRAGRLCVLARTDERGGNRGHSLFMVEKARLEPRAVRALPKARTHGIRGIDISGVAFDGAVVDASARIGSEGAGAEIVLRALQVTRTMCAALSLGAGEHALRLGVEFASGRVIAGLPLVERPNVRATLASCGGLLMAVEAAGVMAARSIQALPGEMSAVSLVAKGLAPTLVDALICRLGELLGLRAFLTGELEHGAFQKLQRDHQVVAIFDGSTVVTRHALIGQLPRLARGYRAGSMDAEGLRRACTLGAAAGPLGYAELSLASRRGVSALAGLAEAVRALDRPDTPPALLAEARAFARVADAVHERAAAMRPSARPAMAAFELAADYELCFAAAACVHLWAANRRSRAEHPLWDTGLWARICLRELRLRLTPATAALVPVALDGPAQADATDAFVDWLSAAVDEQRPLSAFDDPSEREHAD